MIDTNAINARQGIKALNQLERWRKDGVIMLMMPERAFKEADAGDNAERSEKALRQVCSNSERITQEHHRLFAAISTAIFPKGVRGSADQNDVEIVYQAADWDHVLVTADGGSKRQPGGILGAKSALFEIGVTVIGCDEALEYVRKLIKARDERLTSNCEVTGTPEPE